MKIRIGTTEGPNRYHHYATVVEHPNFQWIGTLEGPFDDACLQRVDALIVSCEHHLSSRLAISACKQKGIPTFHVIDGILEWRNLFENPRSNIPENGPPLFRPLLADRTFCMGETQQWILQWLGNERVVATGLPRLDSIVRKPCRQGPVEEVPTVMVATANTPWFTPEQETCFHNEFSKLVSALLKHSEATRLIWRVAPPVARKYGMDETPQEPAWKSLSSCQVLITTPSSLAVEGMLLGVPTLIFDPYASPSLMPCAWSASSASSVIEMLPSLLAPTNERAHLQNALRNVIIPHDQGASGRIIDIVLEICREMGGDSANSVPSPEILPLPGNPLKRVDLEALAATIPALEMRLAEKETQIKVLLEERNQPSFRHVAGCFYRFLKRQLSPKKRI